MQHWRKNVTSIYERLTSTSLYDQKWSLYIWTKTLHANWSEYVQHAMNALYKKKQQKSFGLIGLESLSERDRLAVMTAKMLRELLQQKCV